ncbi:hypothetical protein TSAR_009749 [Trichomalopsis sarcophagae]|uniref:Uncharacterized protein n=1 Tax=Trichomalopsis sarcophagae TaxID=543379 RepID=A0A232FJS6_9HYME|nr:hypothetical protein TSAR_009749 [Trichomalopsis sarcophagae]
MFSRLCVKRAAKSCRTTEIEERAKRRRRIYPNSGFYERELEKHQNRDDGYSPD